ncbi:MAG TPA: hypothetical protein PK264_23480, partial [Hyphomicrobiaceae bacterium]|nr:hypothetical protein [Hyphomicrobiaceae bacterium]
MGDGIECQLGRPQGFRWQRDPVDSLGDVAIASPVMRDDLDRNSIPIAARAPENQTREVELGDLPFHRSDRLGPLESRAELSRDRLPVEWKPLEFGGAKAFR